MTEMTGNQRDLERGGSDEAPARANGVMPWAYALVGLQYPAAANTSGQTEAERLNEELAKRLQELEADRETLRLRQEDFEKEQETFRQRQEDFERRLEAFGQQEEELKRKQAAILRQTEERDANEHRSFIKSMRAVSAAVTEAKAKQDLTDGVLDAILAGFDSSLDTLDGLAPTDKGYGYARETASKNSSELLQALNNGLSLSLARKGEDASKQQLATTEAQLAATLDQNAIFKTQLRLGQQAAIAAFIGAALTAIIAIFTSVNYGTGTAVNLNTLKQS